MKHSFQDLLFKIYSNKVMSWKLLEKIKKHKKSIILTDTLDTSVNSSGSEVYDIKIKTIKKVTIKNKENGR